MKTYTVEFTEQDFKKLETVISKFIYEYGYKNVGGECQSLIDVLSEAAQKAQDQEASEKAADEKKDAKK